MIPAKVQEKFVGRVLSVHTGRIAPLGPDGERSAFIKHAVVGPIQVTTVGLVGDEQADPSVHGGPEKAVYGYCAGHYAAWRTEYPQQADLFVPGGRGKPID